MDTKTLTYYYKTYFNSAITAVILNDASSTEAELSEFSLKTEPEIRYSNNWFKGNIVIYFSLLNRKVCHYEKIIQQQLDFL